MLGPERSAGSSWRTFPGCRGSRLRESGRATGSAPSGVTQKKVPEAPSPFWVHCVGLAPRTRGKTASISRKLSLPKCGVAKDGPSFLNPAPRPPGEFSRLIHRRPGAPPLVSFDGEDVTVLRLALGALLLLVASIGGCNREPTAAELACQTHLAAHKALLGGDWDVLVAESGTLEVRSARVETRELREAGIVAATFGKGVAVMESDMTQEYFISLLDAFGYMNDLCMEVD